MTKKVDGSHAKSSVVPAGVGGWRFFGGTGEVRVNLGRRTWPGSSSGHETMKVCARLYAQRAVRAVS